MASSKESLFAIFGMDIAPLLQSLKRATSSVEEATTKMGKQSFGALLAPIASVAAAVGSVAAIMEGMKGGLELGAQMQQAAQQTGITAGNFYMLRLAAKDVGLEVDKLPGVIGKMQAVLASSVNGGGQSALLTRMGLDPKQLAQANPDEAFREIGAAIDSVENRAARAGAAKAIFGKSGTELLRLFADPEFKNSGKLSEAATVINNNAALFEKIGDDLEHVWDRLKEIFVGLDQQLFPSIDEALKKLEGVDFTSWGKKLGNVVAGFFTDFSNRMAILGSLLKEVFMGVILPFMMPFAVLLKDSAIVFGRAIKEALLEPPAWIKWTMDHAKTGAALVSLISDPLRSSPFSKGLDSLGAPSPQNGPDFLGDMKKALDASYAANSGHRDKMSELFEKLAAPTTWLESLNKNARDKANEDAQRNGVSPLTGDLGLGGKGFGLISDSLARLGGGGNVQIGGETNPIVLEQKRSNTLLQQILTETKNNMLPAKNFPAGQFAFSV